jgi:hypothetical protein
MCYDHLAGMVGVSVTEALLERGLLRERDGGYLVAADGAAEFSGFGIDVDRLERRTWPSSGQRPSRAMRHDRERFGTAARLTRICSGMRSPDPSPIMVS